MNYHFRVLQVDIYLLSRFKGQRKVVAPVFRLELTKVKRVRVVVMNQGTKSHAVVPAGAEILDLHVLRVNIGDQRKKPR